MRKVLSILYWGSSVFAGVFLVLICLIVVLQVGGNSIDRFLVWIVGEPIGFIIPSYADFAGFFLAACTFLAASYTLRTGGHIRVNLLIKRFPVPLKKWVELWCTGMTGIISAYLTYHTSRLTIESFQFGDLSPGMIAVPIWIPQSLMVLGLALLTITFFDEFCKIIRGQDPSYNEVETCSSETNDS